MDFFQRLACFKRLLLVLGVGIALFGGNPRAFATNSQPNVVVIMTDDAGYNGFGFQAALSGGPTKHLTPNLDALASQGVVARQAYANTLCTTSRVALLSGQYPARYGIEDNLGSGFDAIAQSGDWGLTQQQTTIAQRLKSLGYTTGLIGKWHAGYQDGLNRPTDKGFDETYGLLGGARGTYFPSNAEYPSGRMMRNNVDWENPANPTQYWGNEGDQSQYDPTRGRYQTDAFGEEAADFINRHANDLDGQNERKPFFLYVPLEVPHSPLESKASDLALFSNPNDPAHYVTDPSPSVQVGKQNIAAMIYAADRAVGKITSALTANGLDNNTIVIFTNDNGGELGNDNYPLRGTKGSGWEGGSRVPFIYKAPGLTPGQYTPPINFYDVLPTLVSAAGGDISQIPTDGVNLTPYLTGAATGNPHDILFMRQSETWTVRKGDYKLTHVAAGTIGPSLYNVVADPSEVTNLITAQTFIVQDLLRELTFWEATLAKQKYGALGAHDRNDFDHFVFRSDAFTNATWSTANAWLKAGTNTQATMNLSDAYANAIVEIPIRNDADFTTTNDLFRISRQTFMFNQLRLSGEFTGNANRTGFVKGNTALFQGNLMLLTKDLSGNLPQLRLDATSNGTNFGFTFQVSNDLELMDNLEITGNGTQEFVFSGALRDFAYPLTVTPSHSVTKSGTSRVTLNGTTSFRGSLTINGGKVRLNAAGASINGPTGITIGSAGNLTLDNGSITVPSISNSAGGQFDFNGGTLKVINFNGSLTNTGGNFSPGASPALSTISGNYAQNSASKLTMELGGTTVGTQYDKLTVAGFAALAGTLQVSLINSFVPQAGNQFELLLATGGVNGIFSSPLLPALSSGLHWRLAYGPSNVRLFVDSGSGTTIITIPGDYNGNGVVDAADYALWRDTKGSSFNLAADGDSSGTVDDNDFLVWRANFGHTVAGYGSGSGSLAAVPEPASLLLTIFAASALLLGARRSSRQRRHAA